MSESTDDEAARIELTEDAWHEGEQGYFTDCPACGAPATLATIVDYGTCSNGLPEDHQVTEVGMDADELDCDADLTLELAWESS
ncbi:hypothetical protein [Haladaptatus sp. DYSN1]|uniref:hypothetical protein n=1 Tax=unclassified Haladaptatus TaxID=2622732 RepID=UPI002404D4B9|nr:hypothetical protein [Haladaptatus sp. DYSN1]